MYGDIARQLGFEAGLVKEAAGRTGPARALFGLLPQAKNPILHEVQAATEAALTGAFLGETTTDLLQKDKLRGHAALVGATGGLGQMYGARYLPRVMFPGTYAKALEQVRRLPPAEAAKVLELGHEGVAARVGKHLGPKAWVARGLGALGGVAAGLLALQGLKYLKKKREEKNQK